MILRLCVLIVSYMKNLIFLLPYLYIGKVGINLNRTFVDEHFSGPRKLICREFKR